MINFSYRYKYKKHILKNKECTDLYFYINKIHVGTGVIYYSEQFNIYLLQCYIPNNYKYIKELIEGIEMNIGKIHKVNENDYYFKLNCEFLLYLI